MTRNLNPGTYWFESVTVLDSDADAVRQRCKEFGWAIYHDESKDGMTAIKAAVPWSERFKKLARTPVQAYQR